MNPKKSINKILAILILIFTISILNSCNRDEEPVAPTNETTDKGHDEWSKVEFTFYEGHTHGWSFHATPIYPDSIKYFRKPQTVSFQRNSKGDVEMSPNTTINLLGGRYYAIIINYYNVKGELMDREFVENGMDRIHQHFFTTENIRETREDGSLHLIDGIIEKKFVWINPPTEWKEETITRFQGKNKPTKTSPFYYVYQDKEDTKKDTPLKTRLWDANAPKEYDPIGLKGYIYISPDTYFQKFDLRVFLAHFMVPTKLKKSGDVYQFNDTPHGADTDLSLTIPIYIYSSVKFEGDEEEMEKFYYPEAAKAFDITVEEAKKDYKRQLETTPKLDPESSPIWL